MLTYAADLEKLRQDLCEADNASDLADLLQRSFDLLPLEQVDVADQFETNKSTVSRWASGKIRPSAYMRREVIAYLSRMAEKQMRVMERRLAPMAEEILAIAERILKDGELARGLGADAKQQKTADEAFVGAVELRSQEIANDVGEQVRQLRDLAARGLRPVRP